MRTNNMKKFSEERHELLTIAYDNNLERMFRGLKADYKGLTINRMMNGLTLPPDKEVMFNAALQKHSKFRKMATVIESYDCQDDLKLEPTNVNSLWAAEGESLAPVMVDEDFSEVTLKAHKVCSFIKLDDDLVYDRTFDVEGHLLKTFGRALADGEDMAFINGDGVKMPTGILADAEIGYEANALSYDTLLKVYFSLDEAFRENALWLMNDETAVAIRSIVDTNGMPIFDGDTLFGKSVVISKHMPSSGKVIAFGDFSYYWIIDKAPVAIKNLIEVYALQNKVAYLASKRLDGKLVRSDAIKLLNLKG